MFAQIRNCLAAIEQEWAAHLGMQRFKALRDSLRDLSLWLGKLTWDVCVPNSIDSFALTDCFGVPRSTVRSWPGAGPGPREFIAILLTVKVSTSISGMGRAFRIALCRQSV